MTGSQIRAITLQVWFLLLAVLGFIAFGPLAAVVLFTIAVVMLMF